MFLFSSLECAKEVGKEQYSWDLTENGNIDVSCPEVVDNEQNTVSSFLLHLVILVKTAVVFALTFRFSGFSRCGKRQKKAEEGWLVTYNYVSHTFATHSSPVYDVTDTDSWAENGSAQGRVFAIFKPRFSTNKQRQNSSEKLKFCVSRTPQFFPFLSVGPVKTF